MVRGRNTDFEMAASEFQLADHRFTLLLFCTFIIFLNSSPATASCEPDLTDREVTFVPPPAGGMSCRIVRFNLSYHKISKVSTGNFTLYPNLKFLNLAHNRISTLEDGAFTLGTNSQLEDIDLRGNPLVVLRPGAFANLSLESLFLESCQLVAIGPDLFSKGLSIRRQLDLSGNRIRYVPKHTFDSLRQVRFIDLSRNKIEVLNSKTFAESRELSRLDLSSNDLTELPNDVISGLTNLKKIDVSNNMFHPRASFSLRLDFFNPSFSLYARNCSLETIPKILGPETGVIRMHIEGNPLNDICECSDVNLNLTGEFYLCNNGSLSEACFDEDVTTTIPTERDKGITMTTRPKLILRKDASTKAKPGSDPVEKVTTKAGGTGSRFIFQHLQDHAMSILPWAVIVVMLTILGIIFVYKKREGRRKKRNVVQDIPEATEIEMNVCDIE